MLMECSVTGVETQPLIRWRISGREYTPSTLPDRYFPSSHGLLIYSVSPGDDGVTVQCFIVLYYPSSNPPYTVINSSVGVIHVILRDNTGQVSSYNRLHNSTPTLTPTPFRDTITTFTSPASPSVGHSFSISEVLVTLFVVAILTLILTSTVVLCLALHLIKRRGKKIY